jgi:hypothetical protein
MATLSPVDTVISGFRFARARPAQLLIWSAYLLVVLTVAYLAFLDLGGDKVAALVAATQGAAPDVRQVALLMQDLMPASAFALLLIVVFGAVLVTAVLRAYLELGPQSWGGLRLGGEELRVLGVGALMLLCLLIGETLAAVVASVVAVQLSVLGLPILLLGYVLVIALGVRLSLAPVIALVEDRISLRRSWLMTRKAFWRLAGAYVLLAAIMLVALVLVLMLFGLLITAAAAVTGGLGQLMSAALQRNYQDINPVVLGLYVLMNLAQVWIAVVFLTVNLAISVEAYRLYAKDAPK